MLLVACARATAPFLLADAHTNANKVGFVLVLIAPPKSLAMVELTCRALAKATMPLSESVRAMDVQRASAVAQVSRRKKNGQKRRRIVFPLLFLIAIAMKKLAFSSGQCRQSQASRWI